MRPYRLYCPNLTIGSLELSPEESHHIETVLRCRVGEAVVLFDGKGGEANAVIGQVHHRRTSVEVREVSHRSFEFAYRLTIAVAMPKAHRQGFLIEKCTELGVLAIWPVATERSVAGYGNGAVEKWKRKAIEAAKQSRRAWLSDIAAAQDFESVVGRFGEFDAAFMAQSGSGSVSFLTALGALPESSRVLVLIGPEGGWSDPELQRAQAGRAIACTLGPTILRTETAAASVCAIAAGLSRSSTTG